MLMIFTTFEVSLDIYNSLNNIPLHFSIERLAR